MLAAADLERLKSLWIRERAQIVPALASGLPEAEARRLTAEHQPLELTDELALWFSWHNGAPRVPGRPTAHGLGGGVENTSLEICLESHSQGAEFWDEHDAHLLPLFGGSSDLILARCAPDSPQTSEIWLMPWSEDPRPILPNFGALIGAFIELIEVGAWSFAASGSPKSTTVDELVPARWRALRIA